MEVFCRKLAGNRDDGDDLYQDALLTAMNRLESLKKPESFRPWLYRIIVNKYRSRMRREWMKNRLRNEDPIRGNGAIKDVSGQIAARALLEKAFEAVSASEKALITLFELEGWSVSELAAMFGKSEGTIKSRLSRARKKMKEKLKKHLSESSLKKVEAEYALPHCKTSAE